MNALSREQFSDLLVAQGVKKKWRDELKFAPEDIEWGMQDFLTVFDKSRQKGILLYSESVYVVRLAPRKPSSTGRLEPIICDICATWRRGSESASLTFVRNDKSTVSYLVCADLECSLHIRSITKAAQLSRTQLREDIDVEGRVRRLHERLSRILSRLR